MRTMTMVAATGIAAALAGCSGGTDAAGTSTGSTTSSSTTGTDAPGTSAATSATGTDSGSGTGTASAPGAGTETQSATTSAPAPATTAPGDPTACTADTVTFSVAAVPGSAGAGSHSLALTVKNSGTTPCTLKGYPGLQLLAAAKGPALAAPASRTAENPAPAVTVAPSGTATAEIRVSQAANHEGCTVRDGTMLQVILPDRTEETAVPLSSPVKGCAETDVQVMSVKQFTAAS